MLYTMHYESPLGGILLAADDAGLTGLWFDGAKYFADGLALEHAELETPVLAEAVRWLDRYFGGAKPDFTPQLHPVGSPFRLAVWELLTQIPYSHMVTYGELAERAALRRRRGAGEEDRLRRPASR